MRSYFSWVLILHLLYCALCIAWNMGGLYQLSQGAQPIGPTASFSVIAVLLLLAAVLVYAYICNKSGVYFAVACIIFSSAGYATWNAFTQTPDLWPSELWRYAGIGLNTLGMLTFFFTVTAFLSFRRSLQV